MGWTTVQSFLAPGTVTKTDTWMTHRCFTVRRSAVIACSWHPSGDFLASCDKNKKVVLWSSVWDSETYLPRVRVHIIPTCRTLVLTLSFHILIIGILWREPENCLKRFSTSDRICLVRFTLHSFVNVFSYCFQPSHVCTDRRWKLTDVVSTSTTAFILRPEIACFVEIKTRYFCRHLCCKLVHSIDYRCGDEKTLELRRHLGIIA
jgi:WD40 repeat protein